ncbi:MAG: choice-of-anchor B family protein [Crocinitomicaceae bacterium]|nr:choice-of-anchor B family protein [Crocinitomicaceae bacterium]
MKLISSLFLALLPIFSFSQLNIDSVGHVDYTVLHQTGLNDVWGYVDENDNEYALVGGIKGTGVVDVTDPSNPNEVFWEPGMESIWRDLKTFGDYAYVTTEAQNGLLIIDLSPLPASTALTTNYYFGPAADDWASAHNIYVDSLGYAYIFGANRGNGGVIILDVATDPMNPIEVGIFDDWYVHDGYVLGDTMYLAHISDGFISIVDISDRANPVLLGTKDTPSNFAHNIWTSADGQFAYTTDELPYSYITAYDVSDPTNIVEVDRIQSSPGVGTIPHNAHVMGDYVITSHYSDGVIVHDVTHPYNMIEVGEYDTYPGQIVDYDGCWGAYPYLPSGLLLATDRTEGLYLLSPTYVQAAYLEGIVTDASTTNPIDLVDVMIQGDDQPASTDVLGFYATGIVGSGTYDVTYSKVGYFPQTISVDLLSGVITNQDVALVPIPPYNLTVRVRESGTNNPIIGADIRLECTLLTDEDQSNGLGDRDFTLFYQEQYSVTVGKWGYYTDCFSQVIDQTTGEIIVFLEPGIYDDFTFDFGWTTSGTASTGLWERGKPNGSTAASVPSFDVGVDCGGEAYVTGNANNVGPDDDDVDDGTAILISPVMDLTNYADPQVNYARWFYTQFGPSDPDDSLKVIVSNGITTAQIDIVGEDVPNFGTWQYVNLRLQDFITVTSTMQFFFRTSDLDPDINITEAGVDIFFINEHVVGLDELSKTEIKAFPNPTNGTIELTNIESEQDYRILNTNGQVILDGSVGPNASEIILDSVESGLYFIHVSNQIVKIFKTK